MARFRRPTNKRRRARILSRQPMAVVAIAAALAVGALAADRYAATRPQAEPPATGLGDEEIYTGSILYMPDDGKICRQLLFNNRNGRFSDNANGRLRASCLSGQPRRAEACHFQRIL